MKLSREQLLAEMGITPIWRARTEGPAAGVVPVAATRDPADGDHRPVAGGEPPQALADSVHVPPVAVDSMDWAELTAQVRACRKCALCEQRRQEVLGVGDYEPDWLFIGEGPGAEEDARGEPFVGQAGKLLDAMLAAMGLRRGEKVYIANAVKCRPPGNRTPDSGEMAACRPYLERQVALLRPKVIVLLGKAAVHSLLREDKSLAALRGQRYEWHGIPVVVTYHPAYLLRNLPDKAKAWEDLLFARRCLREGAVREGPLLI